MPARLFKDLQLLLIDIMQQAGEAKATTLDDVKQEREAVATARREALEAAIAVDNATLATLSKKELAKVVKPTDCASQQINFDPNVKATGATVSTELRPLEIKAGNYYRTRDGQKAFVAAVALDNPFDDCVDSCPVEAYYGKNKRRFISREGKVAADNSDRPNDLIAEWHEPRQATYIVYMLQDDTVPGGVDLLVQSDYVPFHTSRTILARHKHTLIEGDGMSDTSAP